MHFHSRRKALSHFLRRCPGCPAMQCLAPPTHTHTEGFYHYSEVFCIWDMWDLASFHPPHVILYSLCVTCRVFSQCFVPGGGFRSVSQWRTYLSLLLLVGKPVFPIKSFMCLPPNYLFSYILLFIYVKGVWGQVLTCVHK